MEPPQPRFCSPDEAITMHYPKAHFSALPTKNKFYCYRTKIDAPASWKNLTAFPNLNHHPLLRSSASSRLRRNRSAKAEEQEHQGRGIGAPSAEENLQDGGEQQPARKEKILFIRIHKDMHWIRMFPLCA
jgi:hypothetical protein